MATAKFVLKEPNSKDETLIYLLFSFNNQRLKYSFNEKIHPKFWNAEKQRVKETKSFPEYPEFNARLNNIENIVNSIYRKLVNDNIIPTSKLLREELNNTLAEKQNVIKGLTLFEFIDELITNSTKKQGTIIHYKQARRVLKEYCADCRKTLSFDDINLDFYENYLSYLRNRGYSENTIGGYIKHIKTFMNEAVERKLTTNFDFRSSRFKKTQEVTDKIYLTLTEIENIYKLNLSYIKKLEQARDLFIIGCYTGLRFSDLSQISTDNFINNDTQLKVKTEKTGEFVIIPLHKTIKDIVAKYDNEVPKAISNQKMNDYLKDIAKLANLKDKVSISMTKGGTKQTEILEKWQLVTVHTARYN